MENEDKYFTTGEFAKLCKVNKQTLFYYDQIGLLSPVKKNSKGYRFYSIRQLELFNVIDLLKDLGMSLNDIRQYTQHKSPEKFLSLMYQQRESIVKKRTEIERNEKIINAKIKLIEEASYIDFNQIILKSFSATNLYLSKNIKNISDEDFVKVVSNFIDELYVSKLDTGHQIGGMTLREEILKGEYTNYSYLYMEQSFPKGDSPFFQTIKGDFLIGYHIGLEETIEETYKRLFDKMNYLDLQIGEYVFEEYVYDTVVRNCEDDYVTKIILHVV